MKIDTISLFNGDLVLNRDFKSILFENNLKNPEAFWAIEDEPVKKVLKERGTGRFYLRGVSGKGIECYIKRYTEIPFKKKIKDFLSLKFKAFDAFNEWRALLAFHENLLPTLIPVAAGRHLKGSFCVTLGLRNYQRASDLLKKDSGFDKDKRRILISNIAIYVANMHKKGFAHQDLYLVHFFIREDLTPYLIDLQRVIIQKDLRRRWAIKDLAELLFSARLVLSREETDLLIDEYSREVGFDIRKDKRLFRDIEKKAARIMARHKKRSAA